MAFSGGPDSTALLAGLIVLREELSIEVVAAHYDHRLDPDSRDRARAAVQLARGLDVRCELGCRAATDELGASLEETARQRRYEFLEQTRRRLGARWVATAHHRDDQAETVLLRLLQGTGLIGLAAIRQRHGRIVRPLLFLERCELREVVRQLGLEAVLDPTNAEPHCARNRLRSQVLPHLVRDEPRLVEAAARLARAAAAAQPPLARIVASHLDLRARLGVASLDLARFAELEPVLQRTALAVAGWRIGAVHSPTRRAMSDVRTQLARGAGLGCDGGHGLRVEGHGDRLFLFRNESESAPFSYTLKIPGCVWIPESSAGIRVRCSSTAAPSRGERSWCRRRLRADSRLTVRTRRPGDWTLISGGRRRTVKDIMSSAHLPRPLRDRLPLVCDQDRVLWIPGIASDAGLRPAPAAPAWSVELIEPPACDEQATTERAKHSARETPQRP